MAALMQFVLTVALLAPKAPPPRAPPTLHNPLIIPAEGQNLSAFRLDTEVFGWNKAFTEVGAVAMEMARDPQGAHRGETYLLVYPTRSTTPKHNVICHFITHVALPKNPVPLEDAGDYMWTIEHSYQHMWPRRPKYRRPKTAMEVTPLWAPMPARPDEPDAEANRQAGKPPLRAHRQAGACQPWVGFRLRRGKEVRMHPYRPVDVTARCSLLRLTDARTYWGTDTVAASMVRFDFNSSPKNEESARFVVSSVWEEAKHLRFEVVPNERLGRPARARLAAALSPWGTVRFVSGRAQMAPSGPGTAAQATLVVRAAAQWMPMALSLAQDAGYSGAPMRIDDALEDVVVFSFERLQNGDDDAQNPAPAADEQAPAQGLPAAAPAPEPASSKPSYLHDFKVP